MGLRGGRTATLGIDSRIGIYGMSARLSLWLDVCVADHLAPFLGFAGDDRSEIGRRAPKDDAAEVRKLGLQLGIGEASIDLLVELLDDLGGGLCGRADAEEGARFVTRHKLVHAWKVR